VWFVVCGVTSQPAFAFVRTRRGVDSAWLATQSVRCHLVGPSVLESCAVAVETHGLTPALGLAVEVHLSLAYALSRVKNFWLELLRWAESSLQLSLL